MPYTLGIDYGTNSVRALVVDVADGREVGVSVVNYPSGKDGVLLDPGDHHLARQHPGDYLFGLETSVRAALAQATAGVPGFDAATQVIGLGVDTTGSSPLPVDEHNVPVGLNPRWKNHLAAQCWLWKDHTSWREAARITATAAEHRPQYIAKCGNTYSSEWFWSKIWRCANVAPEVFDAAFSWVEFADWVPSVLAGVTDPRAIVRGVCCAGHKGLYHEDWGGLPDAEFLAMLDPRLADLRPRLYEKAHDANTPAGHLCPEWAAKLGLSAGIPIAIGEMDVHYGAIGSGVDEGALVKVIGTSTCDCAVVSMDKPVADIPGICGIVPGAILPGFIGLEAGQSAVGDIFKWWVEGVCEGDSSLHAKLTAEASAAPPGASGLLALDWHNGNRTILVDPLLTGMVLGQTLHTTRAEIYRALIEATAYGARAIIERLREYGVPVTRVICAGGIAEKNPLLTQVYADVTNCTMFVAGSSQACALGAAVAAAVLAGAHPDFPAAQAAMTSLQAKSYAPKPENVAVYEQLYGLYRQLHDAFGGVNRQADLANVMKDLIRLKGEATPPPPPPRPIPPPSSPASTPHRSHLAKHLPSEIWFITGTQHLYGEEPLRQVTAHSQQIVAELNAAGTLPLPLVFKPILTRPEEIRALCLEANSAPNCAGLVLWMHTFSPSKMWIGGLSVLGRPVCHLHTQFNRDLPWAEIDMDFMNLNQAAHGDREHGFIHTRLRLPRKVVVGHWSDAEVQARLAAWMRVTRAWADWQGGKFARFGDNMREVAVTEGDKVAAEARLGFSVNAHAVGDLVALMADVSDTAVNSLCAEYESLYRVVAPLRRGGERHESLRDVARQEIGLRTFLESGPFLGFTDNFQDLHGLKQLPGLATQRLMADGYGFGGEGDWKTSALVRAMKVIGDGLPGGTSFMEDYTYDLNPDGLLVLGSHMLEVCPTIAAAQPTMEIHPLGIGGKEDPVRLVFDAPAGPAINATLIDLGNRFRLMLGEVDTIVPQPLPKLPVARAVWKPRPDFKTAAAAWLYGGGAHHTCYSYTVTTEHLEDLAEIAGVELAIIDGETRLRDFRARLRQDEVYYHLAPGLGRL